MSATSTSIGPIPTLPVYLKLAGRRALLAGGSLAAVWKLELLVAAGATVLVCDPVPCLELTERAFTFGEAVELVARHWHAEDFEGCAVAICALAGKDAVEFSDAARRIGVPVNVIDVPSLCDFQFGTIIARSPLLIGISTDGAAPVFGQALRARIEALLPAAVQAWAQAAQDWRPDLQRRGLGFAARRRFWETFADLALGGSGRGPTEADRDACLAAALTLEAVRHGSLVLVGIGPGNPDLLTMRAVRALQSVEVLVHEPRVGPEILNLARREGRRVAESEIDQSTCAAIMRFVKAGQSVAWIGVGDSATCTRWQQRRDALARSMMPFDSVEGLRCAACPDGCASF